MTNEVDNRLFVIETKDDVSSMKLGTMVRAVSLINDMKTPWIKARHQDIAIQWGERHQRHHERLLGALEGIADYMPPR